MKRPHVILIAGSTFCLLLCGAAGWFYADSLSAAAGALAERDAQKGELDKIYNSNPFPDAANTSQIREDLATLSAWTARMHAACASNNIPVPEVSASQFFLQLQTRVMDLRALASADGQPLAQPNFNFAFDRYLVSNTMPEGENVKRLAHQFEMINRVARIIMGSDIEKLDGITREVFEESQNAPPQNQPPQAGGVGFAKTAGTTAEHFTFRFTARQDALETVLNKLAADTAFIRVTSLRAAKPNTFDLVMPKPDLMAQVKPADVQLKPGESHFPAELFRVMSGPGIPSPLDIVLEMDILTFLQPQN